MTLLERLGGPDTIRAGIAAEFRALNRTPHPSRHERSAVRALTARLAELGLAPVRDGHGNVMADVPAAPGRTAAPRLILQGHLDMVCAVAPGSGFDPLAEPVTVVEADGFLRSDGRSSLGADNNLGNAAVLWLLGRGLSHGPLRLLFTAAEEVGLEGAKQVDPAWLAGADFLLNTDGFHLGRAIVGSAGGRREITLEDAKQVAQKSAMRYDREGDEHYDLLSALQKSIRGSDENAALHYLARLLEAGDLLSPCRRLLVIASEDIGLAYPMAIAVTKACVDAAVQIGLPEAQIPLAEAVVLLATAPKSNASCMAIEEAMADVRAGKSGPPPRCLQNRHFDGADVKNPGQFYRYPHDYPNHYLRQQYLPDGLEGSRYYRPTGNGFEKQLASRLEAVRRILDER